MTNHRPSQQKPETRWFFSPLIWSACLIILIALYLQLSQSSQSPPPSSKDTHHSSDPSSKKRSDDNRRKNFRPRKDPFLNSIPVLLTESSNELIALHEVHNKLIIEQLSARYDSRAITFEKAVGLRHKQSDLYLAALQAKHRYSDTELRLLKTFLITTGEDEIQSYIDKLGQSTSNTKGHLHIEPNEELRRRLTAFYWLPLLADSPHFSALPSRLQEDLKASLLEDVPRQADKTVHLSTTEDILRLDFLLGKRGLPSFPSGTGIP